MDKVYCKYHPATPARWHCEPCRVSFCTSCASSDSNGDEEPDCPLCGQRTRSLGAGNLIRPFWQRIPRFFLFPAHFAPLLFIIVLAILSSLVTGSLFGVLFMLAITIVFFKYAFVILDDTAKGYLEPRSITVSMISDELELPVKQLFLILFIGFVNFKVLEYFGVGPYLFTMLFSIAAFPAAIMVLAVEHSFFKAINPLMLLVTIKRIGPSYFIMCFFLALLLSGGLIAVDMLLSILPESLWIASGNFISMYFILIIYNMMGYVIYQYHEDLGHVVTEEYLETETNLNSGTGDSRFRYIDILLQEGKIAEAENKLIQAINENPGDLAPREKLHRFYIATRNQSGLMEHSADYVMRLLHSKKPSEAMRIYLEASHVNPSIKPTGARERHELAELLKTNGQSRAALNLLNNLHQEFPSYDGIPGAYLLVAQIMFEYFGEERKALQVLDFLKKKYPGHPLQSQLEEYRQVIERMAGLGQPSA